MNTKKAEGQDDLQKTKLKIFPALVGYLIASVIGAIGYIVLGSIDESILIAAFTFQPIGFLVAGFVMGIWIKRKPLIEIIIIVVVGFVPNVTMVFRGELPPETLILIVISAALSGGAAYLGSVLALRNNSFKNIENPGKVHETKTINSEMKSRDIPVQPEKIQSPNIKDTKKSKFELFPMLAGFFFIIIFNVFFLAVLNDWLFSDIRNFIVFGGLVGIASCFSVGAVLAVRVKRYPVREIIAIEGANFVLGIIVIILSFTSNYYEFKIEYLIRNIILLLFVLTVSAISIFAGSYFGRRKISQSSKIGESSKTGSGINNSENKIDPIQVSKPQSMQSKMQDFEFIKEVARAHQNQNSVSSVLEAVKRGDDLLFNQLLQEGALADKADGEGYTPLLYASKYGKTEIVKLLIKQKVNIDRDILGYTSLSYAAQSGYEEIAGLLLENNAMVDPKGNIDKWTPLILASAKGHYKIVEQLLQHKADVNYHAYSGTTALCEASYNGHTDIVKLLIAYGADASAKGDGGHTALMEAEKQHHTEIIRILKDAENNGINGSIQEESSKPEALISELIELAKNVESGIDVDQGKAGESKELFQNNTSETLEVFLQKLMSDHIDKATEEMSDISHLEKSLVQCRKLALESKDALNFIVQTVQMYKEKNKPELWGRTLDFNGSIAIGVTVVPAFNDAEAMTHFHGGYAEFVMRIANSTSFIHLETPFAHWVICTDGHGMYKIHLTYLPALSQGKTSGAIFATDLLNKDELEMIGLKWGKKSSIQMLHTDESQEKNLNLEALTWETCITINMDTMTSEINSTQTILQRFSICFDLEVEKILANPDIKPKLKEFFKFLIGKEIKDNMLSFLYEKVELSKKDNRMNGKSFGFNEFSTMVNASVCPCSKQELPQFFKDRMMGMSFIEAATTHYKEKYVGAGFNAFASLLFCFDKNEISLTISFIPYIQELLDNMGRIIPEIFSDISNDEMAFFEKINSLIINTPENYISDIFYLLEKIDDNFKLQKIDLISEMLEAKGKVTTEKDFWIKASELYGSNETVMGILKALWAKYSLDQDSEQLGKWLEIFLKINWDDGITFANSIENSDFIHNYIKNNSQNFNRKCGLIYGLINISKIPAMIFPLFMYMEDYPKSILNDKLINIISDRLKDNSTDNEYSKIKIHVTEYLDFLRKGQKEESLNSIRNAISIFNNNNTFNKLFVP